MVEYKPLTKYIRVLKIDMKKFFQPSNHYNCVFCMVFVKSLQIPLTTSHPSISKKKGRPELHYAAPLRLITRDVVSRKRKILCSDKILFCVFFCWDSTVNNDFAFI